MAGNGNALDWTEVYAQPLWDADFLTVGAITSGNDLVQSEKVLFTGNNVGNIQRTNMQTSGILPGMQAMKVYAVRGELFFYESNDTGAATGLSGVAELFVHALHATAITFRITDAEILKAPLSMVPAGMGPWGYVADSTAPIVTNGQPANPAKYVLKMPATIEQQGGVNLTVSHSTLGAVNIVTAINTWTGLKASRYYLDGLKLRNATGR